MDSLELWHLLVGAATVFGALWTSIVLPQAKRNAEERAHRMKTETELTALKTAVEKMERVDEKLFAILESKRQEHLADLRQISAELKLSMGELMARMDKHIEDDTARFERLFDRLPNRL